ncbi:sensor histidine kinase [Kordiimonas pumila]|uniref:histidine kinase n=1 Tax=Kordiimonas pumila TaxID=2161677 RepID=A0ABV7D4Y1_9PROT|nr:ATP-binding protein [Kordiimonas pumila]
MGFEKNFSLMLIARLCGIMILMALLIHLISLPGYYATIVLILGLTCALIYELVRFIFRTNIEISRFFEAARYANYNEKFDFSSLGSGFSELGSVFSDILKRFHAARQAQQNELLKLKALLENVPTPLISVHSDNKLTLWNKAARRLFNSSRAIYLDDLALFGSAFQNQVKNISAGEKKLTNFITDDQKLRLILTATEVLADGKIEKLISIQNIQNELDATQLEAWQDLVRVLTHEIMNSITPITSLAATAADLIDDPSPVVRQDVKEAVSTIATRSKSLTQFVTSYRHLTHLPQPQKKPIATVELFKQATSVITPDLSSHGLQLTTSVSPKNLSLNIDADMIVQVLINLIKNSAEALEGCVRPTIHLTGKLNSKGRAVIEVSDNGTGIPGDIVKNIFIPFFTTKQGGSGVGLALTRQIMIAHGGSITVSNQEEGGTKFSLMF